MGDISSLCAMEQEPSYIVNHDLTHMSGALKMCGRVPDKAVLGVDFYVMMKYVDTERDLFVEVSMPGGVIVTGRETLSTEAERRYFINEAKKHAHLLYDSLGVGFLFSDSVLNYKQMYEFGRMVVYLPCDESVPQCHVLVSDKDKDLKFLVFLTKDGHAFSGLHHVCKNYHTLIRGIELNWKDIVTEWERENEKKAVFYI